MVTNAAYVYLIFVDRWMNEPNGMNGTNERKDIKMQSNLQRNTHDWKIKWDYCHVNLERSFITDWLDRLNDWLAEWVIERRMESKHGSARGPAE